MSLPSTYYILHTTKYCKAKGFTLIELLIVITIIGILVATGTYSWNAAQLKARDSRRKTDLKAIQQALESFYQTNGQYPLTSGATYCNLVSYTTIANALQPTFISQLPKDPTTSGTTNYYYRKDSTNTYRLYSILENIKDPDYMTTADTLSGCTGFTNAYRYKVTNP